VRRQAEPATLLVAVDAPLTRSPFIGKTIVNGAELAVQQANRRGGVGIGSKAYRLRVRSFDNAQSPGRAVANVRRVLAAHAVAIVTDGSGVDAYWRLARAARVPICIVYDGGPGLVDPARRPNVFRIAPTDHGIAFRYAEYLIPKGLRVALLTDDSGYGREGRAALGRAFAENPRSVAARIEAPAAAADLAPQVLQARRAHATALLVWAQPRSSRRWCWPRAPPAGTSLSTPRRAARTRSCGRRSRATRAGSTGSRSPPAARPRRVGTGPFLEFQNAFEAAFGAQKVGVRGADGRPVVQPPDYAMYPYDCVRLVAAALRSAGSTDGAKVLAALDQVSIEGANGDSRGFNEKSREGVVDDDVYFARFAGLEYRPVKDDPLSSTLPVLPQER
jgi:ABC-type branched-subunit amino acid transport system substrate-binding protein